MRIFLVCLLIALGLKVAIGQTRRINPELKPYLNEFIKDTQEEGIDVSHIFSQDIIIDYWERDNGNVATSYGRDKDRVVIFVDESRFKARTEQGRKYVMYHEFGHDILNLPHLEHGMMRPSSYSGFFKDGVDPVRQDNYLNKSIEGLFDEYFERNGDGIEDQPDKLYKIVYVVDGDTADIIVDGFKIRLRFLDINTPERGKPGYKEAKNRLKELILNKYVSLEHHGNGRYGRALVYVYLDGVEINQLMYCEGYAVRYKYSNRIFDCNDS